MFKWISDAVKEASLDLPEQEEDEGEYDFPSVNPDEKRLFRLSAMEQLLLVGPALTDLQAGVTKNTFSLEAYVKRATNTLAQQPQVNAMRDRLCAPRLLRDGLFWKHFVHFADSGLLPTIEQRILEGPPQKEEGAEAATEFDWEATGFKFLAEQTLKDRPYMRSVRDKLCLPKGMLSEAIFWEHYFAIVESGVGCFSLS